MFSVKYLVILTFVCHLFTADLFADTLTYTPIQPNWQNNEQFTYQRVTIHNFYMDDSLVRTEQSTTIFHVKIEQSALLHTMQFFNDERNFERQKVENLSTEKLLLYKLIEDIAAKMHAFPYRFQLNDSLITHEPKIINQSDYKTHLKPIVDLVFSEYKEVLDKTEEETERLKEHATIYMLQEEEKVREQLKNDFQYLFSAYQIPCEKDTTIKLEIETKDIALFSEQPFQPIKATDEVTLKKEDNNWLLTKDRVYDKSDFLRKIKLVQPVFANVKPEQLTVIERKKATFETNTYWLLHVTNEAIALLPGVKVVQVTTIQRMED